MAVFPIHIFKYYQRFFFVTLQKMSNVTPMNSLESLGFLHAFLASLSVIVVSELGDKTFFIAAIMAMRHPRLTVFAGAIGALAVMTILSGMPFFNSIVDLTKSAS